MVARTTGAIVLVGPMGSGKTSIGRRVARELKVPFTDSDSLVTREHGPIPAIFAEQGEERFRELERIAVREALMSGGVVALGGGAVLDGETRRELAAHKVVLLTVSPQTVRSRIQGESRPLLTQGEDPIARWEAILEQRRPLYDEVADMTIDTSTGPLADVVKKIVSWVRAGRPAEEDA
jgi:shikimate kinase